MNNISKYHIDIDVTTYCNLRCKYCIEHEAFKNPRIIDPKLIDLLFDRVDELLESDFFKQNYQCISFGFWGGEPTTAPHIIEKFVEKYKKYNNVFMMIFSNGYSLDTVRHILLDMKDEKLPWNESKLVIQISYDGQPAHDIDRVNVKQKPTGEKVRKEIIWCIDNQIPFTIKSTIAPRNFHHMPDCYEDLFDIYKYALKKTQKIFFNSYFPTIDYLTKHNFTDDEIKQYLENLENSLIQLALKDKVNNKINNNFNFFAWFNPSRSLCCAGRDMSCLEMDGKVYKCHGGLYSSFKDDHYITDITDPNLIQKLKETHDYHSRIFNREPERCKNCYAEYCLRCNTSTYDESNKTEYGEKWTDYGTRPFLCDCYRLATLVKKAILDKE